MGMILRISGILSGSVTQNFLPEITYFSHLRSKFYTCLLFGGMALSHTSTACAVRSGIDNRLHAAA